MAVKVLKSKNENKQARTELRERSIDCASPFIYRLLYKAGIRKQACVGEICKSWDVLETIRFLEKNVHRDAPILDIGAYASEMLCALHRLKYANLTGTDLNPKLNMMPNSNAIRYVIGDFMQTPFPDGSFSAVTAISVIEHGFNGKRLLHELSRILKPGGYFIASVDYWPEKIVTSGIRAFGLDWLIFSQKDLTGFIEDAKSFGFRAVGDMDFKSNEKTVKWGGKDYTFAWIALQKQP
jgi:SAM-dependent methyltransferase